MSRKDKISIAVTGLLLLLAGYIGMQTAVMKQWYQYSGDVVVLNAQAMTLKIKVHVRDDEALIVYGKDTEFRNDGHTALPEDLTVGTHVVVSYQKSILNNELIKKVEWSTKSRE